MRGMLLLVVCSGLSLAQTTVNGGRTVLGALDASGAARTSPVRIGATDPGTCDDTKREMFFNTTTNTLKVCTAVNVWAAAGGGGGGAPTGAAYLALATDATLSAERVLIPRDSLVAVDAGANGNYTVDWHPLDRGVFWLAEEFFGGTSSSGQVGALGWKHVEAGTGGYNYPGRSGDVDHPFTMDIKSGTTANDWASISHGDWPNNTNFVGLASRAWESQTIFRVTGAVTSMHLRIGFYEEPTAAFSARTGFFVRYDTSTDTAFRLVIDGTASCTASAGPALGGWYRLRFSGAGTSTLSVSLYNSAGADLFTACTGAITMPGAGLAPFMAIRTLDTTEKQLVLDWWAFKMRGLAR